MWQTFLVNLKLHLREKTQLFWLFAFPIILATMFNGMFGNIAESFELHTLDVVVVEDTAWKTSYGAQTLIDGLSSDSSTSDANGYTKVDSDGGSKLVNATKVGSAAQAERLLADGTVQGMLQVVDGRLKLSVSQSTQSSASDVMASSSGLNISLTVLGNIVDLYNRNTDVVTEIAKNNPTALMDSAVTGSIGSANGYTKEIQLTNFKPSGTARYYYALLGMAALMAMSFAINAVTMTQANLSALGIRRSVSPLPKLRQLLAGFLSSWLCSFLSLTVAMLYIRFGCRISLGGREWAAVGACLVASFAASAFGTLLGALPKIPTGAKHGLCTALACILSLFSGLYGQFAMQLSDQIAQHAPVLSLINPAQQITNLFYDILYYDNFKPFFTTAGILAAMSLVCLAVATVLLRRQRYEYL
ncbi:ABC transporter permease [Bifidobacterium ruminantium]|uniref:ABC transporter permease n=1 Tax=Bifidobacterium ruminantium TaxID=78346 RepID=UPI001C231C73|nr:ABC transporter permease [Bifidobacterium ruminantium]MBU9111284.1 ABC transporter permease [Bifidobacterium ruminantium]